MQTFEDTVYQFVDCKNGVLFAFNSDNQRIPDSMFVYLHFNIPPYKTKKFGCGNV